MFEWLKIVMRANQKRSFENKAAKRLATFDKEHRYQPEGYGGLCISGLVVRDFGYLIRYISDGRFQSLDDQNAIQTNIQLIRHWIATELRKPVLREAEVFGVAHETALQNLENLRKICDVISARVTLQQDIDAERRKRIE